jgi:hypothetical protein
MLPSVRGSWWSWTPLATTRHGADQDSSHAALGTGHTARSTRETLHAQVGPAAGLAYTMTTGKPMLPDRRRAELRESGACHLTSSSSYQPSWTELTLLVLAASGRLNASWSVTEVSGHCRRLLRRQVTAGATGALRTGCWRVAPPGCCLPVAWTSRPLTCACDPKLLGAANGPDFPAEGDWVEIQMALRNDGRT